MEEEVKQKINVDKKMLDCFYRLTDNDTNTRLKACTEILNILSRKQHELEDKHEISEDLKYCVERLVKGLASSRDSARLGFCLLLTEVLKKYPVVEIEDVLELFKKHLVVTNKQDKKDLAFGQLFALTAIVRSERLPNHDCLTSVAVSLCDIFHGKDYILNACYKVILDLFSQLSSDNFKENVWNKLQNKLPKGWETCTAETLWILLLCIRLFPTIVSETYMTTYWGSPNVFSPENLDHFKKFIKQTRSTLPMLHPLCTEILLFAIKRKNFGEIWNAVVDENLFEGDQTEKAFIGFEMIKLALSTKPSKKVVKAVLSSKFKSFFSYLLLKIKHNMYPAAKNLADFLITFMEENSVPEFHILVLKAILQPPGTVLQDEALKKKEVKSIIQNLHPDAVKVYSDILKSIILKDKFPDDENKDANNRIRTLAVLQLRSLVSHPAILSDMDWRINIIKFFFLHAFFTVKDATSEIPHCEKLYNPLPEQVHDACMNAFYRSIDSLRMTSIKQQSSLDIFLEHLMLLVEYAELLLNAPDNVDPLFPLEKIQKSWSQSKTIVHKLSKQSKKDGQVVESNAFKTLFLQLCFMLFQDSERTSELLEELHICCKKALKKRKKDISVSQMDESEPPWIGVVIDILLSLLSKSSNHLRSLVSQVFPLFCSFIDESALQQILDVINPQKDEDMLIDEDEEGNDEKSEDVDFDSGSSSDESDDEQDNQPADDEFRKKIQQALGSAADNSDAESVVLTDSEMFKLDDALSQAFKMRKKTGHSQFASEEKTLLEFRIRVCDLILSFIKSEPPLKLILMCIEPVLAAFEFGHGSKNQEPLFKRSIQILDAITKQKKFLTYQDVNKSDLKRLLDVIIPKCHKETMLSTAQKLYSLCVFIVLCFRKLESSDTSEKKKKSKIPFYIKTYLTNFETFVSCGSSNMFPQFFTRLMESCPDLAWHFIDPCKNYAFSADKVRLFKKTQCLGLLSEVLKYSKAQKDISPEKWLEYVNNVFSIAIETLKNVLKGLLEGTELKPSYFTELLIVVYNCHLIVLEKTGKSLLEDHVDLLPILTNHAIMSKLKIKTGKVYKNRIITALGGGVFQTSPKPKKRLLEAEGDSEVSETVSQTLVNGHMSQKKKNKKRKKKKTEVIEIPCKKESMVDISEDVSDDSD